MNILMFINQYIDLIDPVIRELESQGHIVTVIHDFFEYYDPKDVVRRDRLENRNLE